MPRKVKIFKVKGNIILCQLNHLLVIFNYMKKILIITIIAIITLTLDFLVRVYYYKMFESIDIKSVSASDLNDGFFKKYLIMNLINVISSVSVFLIMRNKIKKKLHVFLVSILFFFILSFLIRFY